MVTEQRNAASQRGDRARSGDGVDILVTGGSGMIGRQMVRRLAEDGHGVVSMYHRRLPEAIQGVCPTCNDMLSAELLAAPLRGVSTVIHMAWDGTFIGPTDPGVEWSPYSAKAPLNAQNTRRLVVAMERAKIRRIVFLSAVGANRHSTDPFLREKYLAEQIVLNSAIPEKIVVRTGVVCAGPGVDKFLGALVKVMRIPGMYPKPRRQAKLAPVHIEDLIRVLSNVTHMELEESAGVIEVVGGAEYKISEILRMVSEKFAGGARLPVGGVMGEWAMSFLERQSKEGPALPQLRHFLGLVSPTSREALVRDNPLAGALPPTMRTFKEALGIK